MSIAQVMLPEYDNEMASTRKSIERVPEDKLSYKPHEKSMPMGLLMSHLVEMVGWTAPTIAEDEFDMHPPGGEPYKTHEYSNIKEALAAFDRNVEEGRKALAAANDETLMKSWFFKNQGVTLMEMPKIACIRGFVMNHTIHHRAQLGVYLRLNGIPVPSIYGPSADEGPQMM
jgi:uncharacterized damage-inducible protein DinB